MLDVSDLNQTKFIPMSFHKTVQWRVAAAGCGDGYGKCGDDNDVLLLFGTPEALKFYSEAYSKRAY